MIFHVINPNIVGHRPGRQNLGCHRPRVLIIPFLSTKIIVLVLPEHISLIAGIVAEELALRIGMYSLIQKVLEVPKEVY